MISLRLDKSSHAEARDLGNRACGQWIPGPFPSRIPPPDRQTSSLSCGAPQQPAAPSWPQVLWVQVMPILGSNVYLIKIQFINM